MSSKRSPSAHHDGPSKRRKLGHVSDKPAESQSPVRMTTESRDQLCRWLDDQERKANGPIFKTAIPSRKGGKKTGIHAQTLQLDHDINLTARYTITPERKWLQLQKFKRFTVAGETHETGACVLVKHNEGDHSVYHQDHWKALVHEVRALDENHVYLRVTWLENPDDLPGGRKPYHGHNELVPSNRMDVIDAMTVNGGIEVKYWNDDPDAPEVPSGDDFFWRQTFDSESGELSALHQICRCDAPHNPDELILQCTNCAKWMHRSCLEKDAAECRTKETASNEDEPSQAATNEEGPAHGATKSGKRRKSKGKTKSKTTETEHLEASRFEAKLIVEKDSTAKIMITDTKNDETTEGQVHCLMCGELVQ